MKGKTTTITVVILLSIGLLAWQWQTAGVLKQAPALTLTTLQGNTMALSELRGHPVLLTFWATTCPGCMKEMPHLIQLYNELHEQGLEIIGIAMAYDPPNHVVRVVQQRSVPYPIALDLMEQAASAFGDVSLTPTSFLIAPDGRIVLQNTGMLDLPRVRNDILAMLPRKTSVNLTP